MVQYGACLIMVGSLHINKGRDRNSAVQFIILTLTLIQFEIVCFQEELESNIDLELLDQAC